MLSENGDVIKIDTTGRNFAGRYIGMCMRRVHLSMRAEGIKAFSKRIRCCRVDGRKR